MPLHSLIIVFRNIETKVGQTTFKLFKITRQTNDYVFFDEMVELELQRCAFYNIMKKTCVPKVAVTPGIFM